MSNETAVKRVKIRLITARQAVKAAKRRSFSLRLMKRYAGLYDCKDCHHGLTDSCVDHLPNGCEYFYDARTGRSFPSEVKHKTRPMRTKPLRHKNKVNPLIVNQGK